MRVLGTAVGFAALTLALSVSTAQASRYEKVCGTFGTSGKVRAHNTSCHKARKLVKKFWRKSQSQGSPLTIDGFACKARFHHGKYEVTCNKDGGKKLVRWRGAMGRVVPNRLSVARGYNKCGERVIYKGASKIIKEKGMRCRSATELARDYERKNFTRHDFPQLGEVRYVGRARCKFLNYYAPYEPAYVCVKKVHRHKKKMKALYPPERIG